MPEITRERVVYRGDRERDRDSDSDDRATGYRTVQRYRVTRSRVEPIEDERRTSRTTLLEVGNRRDAHLNIERASDRFEGPPRPRSAIDIRPRSTIVERYIEREPLRDERSDRTSTVVYERDRDFGRESERDKPSERESPSELERQELKTGYYERPEPAPQPIVIRQRALEPQNIIINEAPAPPPIYLPQLPWEEGFQAIQRREEVQEVARLEPRRATEDEYYYRRDVREVRGPRRSNEDFALTAAAGPLAIAAYHERQEIRPRDSVSDRSYSDDEDVVIRRRIIKKERSRSRDSYHRRHLAEGALASAGAVALLANHRDKEGDVHRGRQVVGGVSLGALGAETLTRTRSRYRERHDDEDRSRSRSSSRHSHRKIKTGLALAAAAKYVSNRRETNAELGRGRSRTRSVSRRRYSSNNDFYDKDRGGMSRSRSRHADPKHRASQIAKAGAATASVAGIVEHFRNKSTKGDGSRSKSRVRTGAEIAAAGLAGAGVAGLYENRKAKEDREQELKARRERRRVRSISPSSDIGDPELGMVQYRTEPVYAYPSYYDLALATSGSAYVGKRNRSRNGRRRHSSESSSERYPRSKSRVRDIAGAAGTAAAAIGINQYKKRKEKKEAERDRDGYSRSRSRSRSASSIRSTLTKRLSNLIPRDSSHADAPTNFAGTRSPGAFPEGVLDSELTTRAGNLRILKYQDSSKAGGRQSVDEDLSRLDKDGQADSTRSATSAKNNEIDCPVLVDGKSLKLENEEASEPWFEPGSPAKVWERRSSSISIGNSFVLDEAEGDLGLTSLDGPSAEPTMEEAMKKEEVKKQDSQFLDSRMLHDRRPSPHRDDLLLGAGKKDTHSQPSPSMGGSAHLSESKIAQDLREDSGPPSQSSSMTDSTLLEDATDWEESDVEIFEHEFSPVGYSQSPGDMTNHSSLVQITLDPAKKEMVERLMQEVWTIFNEKWPTAARECAGAPNDYSSTSRPASGSISQAGNHSGGNSSGFQRSDNREDGKSNENPEKGLGGNGKQPESPSDANQTSLGFACPYRKRDPRKYCVRDWRSCALSPQKTVARVK
jgi:hypothetical protein